RVAHIEAGLRSYDRTMPEEVNRLVTDALADLLLTPTRDADKNLLLEGIPPEKIRFVGNVMIDTLFLNLERANTSNILRRFHLEPKNFCAMTLHRPSNVDDKGILVGIVNALNVILERMPLIFPVHPRTRAKLIEFGLMEELKKRTNLCLTEPLSYLDFL